MKKLLTFIFTFLLLACFYCIGYSQKNLNEGAISYVVTEVNGSGMEAAMMKGSEQTFFFNDDFQKMDVKLLGGSVRVQVISANNSKSSTLMMEGLMGKVMVKSSESDAKKNMVVPEYRISYNKNDIRDIAGYKCHQAILAGSDGSRLVFYVTDQITPQNSFVQKMFKGLLGFPLEYSVDKAGFKLTYKAQSVASNYDDKVFNPATEGYKEVSPEEWEKMFGKLDLGM